MEAPRHERENTPEHLQDHAWVDADEDMDFTKIPVFQAGINGVEVIEGPKEIPRVPTPPAPVTVPAKPPPEVKNPWTRFQPREKEHTPVAEPVENWRGSRRGSINDRDRDRDERNKYLSAHPPQMLQRQGRQDPRPFSRHEDRDERQRHEEKPIRPDERPLRPDPPKHRATAPAISTAPPGFKPRLNSQADHLSDDRGGAPHRDERADRFPPREPVKRERDIDTMTSWRRDPAPVQRQHEPSKMVIAQPKEDLKAPKIISILQHERPTSSPIPDSKADAEDYGRQKELLESLEKGISEGVSAGKPTASANGLQSKRVDKQPDGSKAELPAPSVSDASVVKILPVPSVTSVLPRSAPLASLEVVKSPAEPPVVSKQSPEALKPQVESGVSPSETPKAVPLPAPVAVTRSASSSSQQSPSTVPELALPGKVGPGPAQKLSMKTSPSSQKLTTTTPPMSKKSSLSASGSTQSIKPSPVNGAKAMAAKTPRPFAKRTSSTMSQESVPDMAGRSYSPAKGINRSPRPNDLSSAGVPVQTIPSDDSAQIKETSNVQHFDAVMTNIKQMIDTPQESSQSDKSPKPNDASKSLNNGAPKKSNEITSTIEIKSGIKVCITKHAPSAQKSVVQSPIVSDSLLASVSLPSKAPTTQSEDQKEASAVTDKRDVKLNSQNWRERVPKENAVKPTVERVEVY